MDNTLKSLAEFIEDKMEILSEQIKPSLKDEDLTIYNPRLMMETGQAMKLGYIRGQIDILQLILKHIRKEF